MTPAISLQPKPLQKPVAIKSVKGDGNCWFRALSYGTEANHSLLRKLITSLKRSEEGRALLEGLNEDRDYLNVSQMAMDRVWASEVEIFATSKFLDKSIYIYSFHGESLKWTLFSKNGSSQDSHQEESFLYFINNTKDHFNVVLDVKYSNMEASCTLVKVAHVFNEQN